MLKGIPKIISPELLKILCEMGHGDEIVIADGNFPSENYGKRVIRADGVGGVEMLSAVLSLLPLDTYAKENFILMQTVNGPTRLASIFNSMRIPRLPLQPFPRAACSRSHGCRIRSYTSFG